MAGQTTTADLIERLLTRSDIDIGEEEKRVLAAIAAGTASSRDVNDEASARSSFGDHLSDRVAAVGGSWGFIIGFAVVLFGWMLLNSGVLNRVGLAFDPYPYIFLNLMLSTLAAIQAPIIMMSQNRQAAKDRLAAQLDYETNLRAELELLRLHHKVDELLAARAEGELRDLHAKVDRLLAGQAPTIEPGPQAG
ncbi:DUF1003 domain-containing protein [Sphingomonas rosea]|jgi:uncharacterized membrane protein|uniref:DUF1003 domain-containing protein n=1 Tax=Sphingomonas rosea TaxID=335605 RepID=A0ABP7TP99_9SPHN